MVHGVGREAGLLYCTEYLEVTDAGRGVEGMTKEAGTREGDGAPENAHLCHHFMHCWP